MDWMKQSSRGPVEGLNMSGSGKRVHEDFPSAKQQEEQIGSTAGNGDLLSGDKGPYVDAMAESRPPKLPRVDHANRFYKRMEIDDAVTNNTTVGADSKGDGKVRPSVDEKGQHVESKGNNFDEKRDAEWAEAHANALHDSRIPSSDKSNQIHSSNSSAWRREQWPEKRDDGRVIWKENRDEKSHFKDDAHNKKADKDGSLDFMHDVRNVVNRSTPWKKDQRFDHGDDMRGSRSDYKWNSGPARQPIDDKDHSWDESWATTRRTSMEEEGEVRDSEKTLLHAKVEAKADEKEKDQERKSRDHNLKERDDREKVDRSSRWENDVNNSTDTEKWDKEKKEKALDKKESRHSGEKEETINVKQETEELDVPKKTISEGSNPKENVKLETKSPKEVEASAALEIDEKEKKDEKDQDKIASDGLYVDGTEKDKDSNHNFQQKTRMLRPRGHSVVGNRDRHSRFPGKDADGNQGTADSTAIIYKPGEYMTELLKLWREYELSLASKNGEAIGSAQGPTIEVRIPAKLVTTSNHQVRGNQLWGTDVYTDDSDLVAVLMHTGYYRPTTSYPPPSVQELCATIQVLSPQDSYVSTLRNNVRSRAWGAASGCSYSVIRCRILKVCGGHIDLQPCLTRTSAVAPTLAPAVMERTMTTRAASSNAHRQQRFVQEVTIQYNLCNEPWMKYSMSAVADRGLKKSQYTSARLRKGEVLYLETHRKRYELSYDCEKVACNGTTTATSVPVSAVGDKSKDKDHEKLHCNNNSEKVQGRGINSNTDGFDHYKWALCIQPLPLKVMLGKGVPLPLEYIEVLENGLAWEEIQWSQAGIWVRGKEYPLTRAHFLSQNPLE